MFSFQNALITFALVLAATDLTCGQRYGPDGIRPIRPLGPGGVQPIRPLGPGGVQPIRPLGPGGVQPLKPLGPGGIRKSSDGECCFAYGFGSRRIPCCFEIITCEKHYQLLRMENNGRGMLGGAHGKHHTCPQNAEEAHQILSGQN